MFDYLYQHAALGGTFDHFHKGHEALIKKACEVSEQVLLGLVSDEFLQSLATKFGPRSFALESYQRRKDIIEAFIMFHGWHNKVTIVPLETAVGTADTDKTLEALIVSPETEKIGNHINHIRVSQNISPLDLIRVPWVLAVDGEPIHSHRIRAGEIDRDGLVFAPDPTWKGTLTPDLRKSLSRPQGKLFLDHSKNHDEAIVAIMEEYQKSHFVITVGDAVTQAAIAQKLIPQLSIIDLSIQRKKVFNSISEFGISFTNHHQIANPPGTLSGQSFLAVRALMNKEQYPAVLEVNGEDDLFTLFAILGSPLSSIVLYGQPNEGVVVIEVTLEKKREVLHLLKSFE